MARPESQMRLQACGCSDCLGSGKWLEPNNSTAQHSSNGNSKKARREWWWKTNNRPRALGRGDGIIKDGCAQGSWAGPEGWRKCGAVERCVWRVGPRDALARASRPGCARRRAHDLHTHPCAIRQQASDTPWKLAVGYVGGTNAAAQTTHDDSAHASRRRRRTYYASLRPADRYQRGTFSRTGGTTGSSHSCHPRELCICKCESCATLCSTSYCCRVSRCSSPPSALVSSLALSRLRSAPL